MSCYEATDDCLQDVKEHHKAGDEYFLFCHDIVIKVSTKPVLRKENPFTIDLCKICFLKHTSLFLLPPALFQSFRDNPLQLSVDGAELVGGPLLHRFHRLGIDAEQKGLVVAGIVFLLCHGLPLQCFTQGHLTKVVLGNVFVVNPDAHNGHGHDNEARQAWHTV